MSNSALSPTATLVCSMGLPFSGKSQWCSQFASANHCPIVSPDMIRLAIHGQAYIQSAEGYVWATAHAMTVALFLAGHPLVVLDATNISRKRRDAWRDPRWQTCFHVCGEGLHLQIGRSHEAARLANRPDMGPVISRMVNDWEPLGDDEFRWESRYSREM